MEYFINLPFFELLEDENLKNKFMVNNNNVL